MKDIDKKQLHLQIHLKRFQKMGLLSINSDIILQFVYISISLTLIWFLYLCFNWTFYFKSRVDRDHPSSPSFVNKPFSTFTKTPLNLDHVYLPFSYYLLASFLLLPSAVLLWTTATVKHLLRLRIVRCIGMDHAMRQR